MLGMESFWDYLFSPSTWIPRNIFIGNNIPIHLLWGKKFNAIIFAINHGSNIRTLVGKIVCMTNYAPTPKRANSFMLQFEAWKKDDFIIQNIICGSVDSLNNFSPLNLPLMKNDICIPSYWYLFQNNEGNSRNEIFKQVR